MRLRLIELGLVAVLALRRAAVKRLDGPNAGADDAHVTTPRIQRGSVVDGVQFGQHDLLSVSSFA